MPTARSKVMALAKGLGATVRVAHDPWDRRRLEEVTAEAPAGMVWSETGDVHELVCCAGYEEPASSVWADLLQRMKHGLEPCQLEDCDWCSSNQ